MGTALDQAAEAAAAFLATAQAEGATDDTPILDIAGYDFTFGDLRTVLGSLPGRLPAPTGTDYRAQAVQWAGPEREAMVDVVALFLHRNESLHMHEAIGEPCCAYCWLRAGKAVMALVTTGVRLLSANEMLKILEEAPDGDRA